jgi:hypothetical protein
MGRLAGSSHHAAAWLTPGSGAEGVRVPSAAGGGAVVGAPVGEDSVVGGGLTDGDAELAAGVDVAMASDGEADGLDPAWQALARTAATLSRNVRRCMCWIVPTAGWRRKPTHVT